MFFIFFKRQRFAAYFSLFGFLALLAIVLIFVYLLFFGFGIDPSLMMFTTNSVIMVAMRHSWPTSNRAKSTQLLTTPAFHMITFLIFSLYILTKWTNNNRCILILEKLNYLLFYFWASRFFSMKFRSAFGANLNLTGCTSNC